MDDKQEYFKNHGLDAGGYPKGPMIKSVRRIGSSPLGRPSVPPPAPIMCQWPSKKPECQPVKQIPVPSDIINDLQQVSGKTNTDDLIPVNGRRVVLGERTIVLLT